jgi:methionyl-tRNA synthetase
MKEKILITAALLYANGKVHFGHLAGAYLPADIYARFKRMKGDDVLFISGSDEYGVAITLSAELVGRTPKEQVDHFHQINVELFKKMHVSFDHYSRTTWSGHAPITQEFFTTLLKNGYVEEKATKQLYSEKENRFLADRYVVGDCPKCGFKDARGDECPKCGGSYEATDLLNPRSKITNSSLVLKETNHWFLRCDLFKEKLNTWLDTRDWKSNVTNFIRPYIEELRPRAITRDAEWGVKIPLPNTEGKVLYVWFDAPIGYISATQEWAEMRGEPKKWEEYWLDPKTKSIEFIGKDNIIFHAMFFPSMLMGQDKKYKLVDQLPANEFFNLEGKKFSKSSGWYVDLEDFLSKYSAECLRYTIAANAPETQDSEFTWSDFQMRVNSELVGKFGNFVHRTLTFLVNKMDQKIPEPIHFSEEDSAFMEDMVVIAKEAATAYEHFKLRKATQCIMELASKGNAYFDFRKPWNLNKEKELSDQLNTVIYCCLSAIKVLAVISFPVIPETAEKIWKMLGFQSSLENENWNKMIEDRLTPGILLSHPTLLFEKLEDDVIKEEISKLMDTVAVVEPEKDPAISYEQFSQIDLRVAKIEHVERVPKSNKLLKLQVSLGEEKRTVVSGIAKYFENLDVLIGRNVVLVANLKPAKLMGIESHGMILATGDGGDFLELLSLQHAKPGSKIS